MKGERRGGKRIEKEYRERLVKEKNKYKLKPDSNSR